MFCLTRHTVYVPGPPKYPRERTLSQNDGYIWPLILGTLEVQVDCSSSGQPGPYYARASLTSYLRGFWVGLESRTLGSLDGL